jgi:hypothetical protein
MDRRLVIGGILRDLLHSTSLRVKMTAEMTAKANATAARVKWIRGWSSKCLGGSSLFVFTPL